MVMRKPRVSVIIPVYNGERFLRDAVDSVWRQRYEPLEIIIVDDGSTDGTKRVATSPGGEVHYAHQQNRGPPAARNTGLRLARGTLIGFLDADDLWTDQKLEFQVAQLMEMPTVDVVLGYTKVVYLDKRDLERGGEVSLPPGPVPSLGAALVRAASFERAGVLDETLRYDDDVDWFLRVKESGLSLRIHEDIVQLYRRHDQNLTNQKDLDQRFFIATLKKSLDRRRRAGGGTVQPLPPWFESEEQ